MYLVFVLLLVLPLAHGEKRVRCCRDCETSADCSDVGDYLGPSIDEDAATFCTVTMANVLGEPYYVCDEGTTNPGAGLEMCCDPGKACGTGFCIEVLGPGGPAWCADFNGQICPMDDITANPVPSPTEPPAPAPTDPPVAAPTEPPVTAPTSTPAPVSTPSGGGGSSGGGCFSEVASVHVLDMGPVKMKDLEVGHKILTGTNKNGKPIYETLYSFGHHDEEVVASYLRISTETTKEGHVPLEITGEHLVFVGGPHKTVRRADALQVGDILLHKSLTGEDQEVAITSIDKVQQRGLYQPLTPSGKVVVDGVHASAYVSIGHMTPRVKYVVTNFGVSEHNFFHLWMAPYQFVCTQISPALCEDDYDEEEGFIHWLVWGLDLALFAEELPLMLRTLGLVLVSGICSIFALVNATLQGEWWALSCTVLLFCLGYASTTMRRGCKSHA